MNAAGKKPHISYCLIPPEYPDLERFRDSSGRPKRQASYLLVSSPMEVPQPVVPPFCIPELCWLYMKHLGIFVRKILIQEAWGGDKEMCISVTPKLRLSPLNHHSPQKACINKK